MNNFNIATQYNNTTTSSNRKPWTYDDLSALKSFFSEKTPLKIMAQKLDRTETSINKALARHGIRIQRQKITSPKKIAQKKQTKRPISVYENAVSMSFIVRYLEEMGHKVQKNSHQSCRLFSNDFEYIINNKPVSKAKLVLIANSIRQEFCQPTFMIDERYW